jgi:hypothetical protein
MINYKVFETKSDWATFRGGMFTASEVHRLMAEPKKKGEVLSEGAKTYIRERVAQQLAPREPEYYNSSMEHGNETEPQAVMAIAESIGKSVNDDDFIYTSEGGFVYFWDELLNLGGTPDVILRGKRIFEIKCPLSKTHLEYLMLESHDDVKECVPQYYAQMQANMYLTGLEFASFVSFDDRYYDKAHHLHKVTVFYDVEFMAKMKQKLQYANEYKAEILNKIKKS